MTARSMSGFHERMASPRMWLGPVLSPSSSLLDEDPGIMSEAETSSTGFRRGVKQRASLPVVRTASKTLEKPLGLVFLQYGTETKRALLPNEITTLDTVRALFVRSFSHQLTMEYLTEARNVRIYIHDTAQDVFYELEDLRDIKDRSILRLYETQGTSTPSFPVSFSGSAAAGGRQPLPPVGISVPRLAHTSPPSSLNSTSWVDPDQSYFSEPEFDSEYNQHHVHKAKMSIGTKGAVMAPYYGAYGNSCSRTGYSSSTPTALVQPVSASASSSVPQGRPSIQKHPPYTAVVERSQPVPGISIVGDCEQNNQSTTDQRSRGGATSKVATPASSYGALSITVKGGNDVASSTPMSSQSAQPLPTRHAASASVAPRPPERSFHSSSSFLSPSAAYTAPLYVRPSVFDNGYGPPSLPPGYLMRSGATTPVFDDETRIRMEHVERQLASLTGLVQTALTGSSTAVAGGSAAAAPVVAPPVAVPSTSTVAERILPHRSPAEIINKRETNILIKQFSASPPPHEIERNPFTRNNSTGGTCSSTLATGTANRLAAPKLGKDRCVSFEKSVSFSDEPIEYLTGGKHTPQPTESKPMKPAIKSSTLPRTSSQAQPQRTDSVGDGDMAGQLRTLQRKARDLRQEMRYLRRLTLAQSTAVRDAVRETLQTLKNTFLINSEIITGALSAGDSTVVEMSMRKIHCDQGNHHREMRRLEKELSELEVAVEDLRSSVIVKKTRVSMADVERLVVGLSQSSKAVADLKAQFPALQDSIKNVLAYQMDKVVDEEKFLTEEPGKLENTMRRCKKLTSTLVTLKRLASVQEQRQPIGLAEPPPAPPPPNSTRSFASFNTDSPPSAGAQGKPTVDGAAGRAPPAAADGDPASPARSDRSKESHAPPIPPRPGHTNPLDALLNELQTFNKARRQESENGDAADEGTRTPLRTSTVGRSRDASRSSSSCSDRCWVETSIDDVARPLRPAPASAPTARRAPPPPPPPRSSSRSPMLSPQGGLFQRFQSRANPEPPTCSSVASNASFTSSSTSCSASSSTGSTASSIGATTSPFLVKVAPHVTPWNQRPAASPLLPPRPSTGLSVTSAIAADQLSLSSRSSSSESVDSQEGNALHPPKTPQPRLNSLGGAMPTTTTTTTTSPTPTPTPTPTPVESPRRASVTDALERRHQQLLEKQQRLQQQYNRLQQLQKPRPFEPTTTPTGAAQASATPTGTTRTPAIAMGVTMLQQHCSGATASSASLAVSTLLKDAPETDIV